MIAAIRSICLLTLSDPPMSPAAKTLKKALKKSLLDCIYARIHQTRAFLNGLKYSHCPAHQSFYNTFSLRVSLAFRTSRESRKLLFPPFSLYRCSVLISPALRRSFRALLVVDSESFRSLDIVGMDGQQMPSLLARSARYLYTDIALWGRSIRYSSVKLRILLPPVQVGLTAPPVFYCVLSAVFSTIEAAFRLGFAGRVTSEYTNGYADRIALSSSALFA